jgi:hypothetical protein
MRKNKPSRRFSATFLVLAVCFIVVFSVDLSSAFDFDNTYDYNNETKTAVINNCDFWFGICWKEGEVLANITLTSPDNVMVSRGDDMLIGTFNFTSTSDFLEEFGNIYLTDLKNGQQISRGKQFKYKKYKNISVDDYESVCENITVVNGTEKNCTLVEVGNHIETQLDWVPVNNLGNIFYSGVTYEIGVFIDVEKGDYGDWVPSVMGVEIEEWATWTENLNVGLVAYYKLDEESGSIAFDSLEISNLTNNGAAVNVSGKINKSYFFTSGDDVNGTITGLPTGAENRTICTWFNATVANSRYIWGYGSGGANNFDLAYLVTSQDLLLIFDGTSIQSTNSFNLNEWHIVCAIYDGDKVFLYVNGTSEINSSSGVTLATGSTGFNIGSAWNRNDQWEGKLDEFGIWNRTLSYSEIQDLYNGGVGITWTDIFVPAINILFPQNITYNETITELNYTVDTADRCWFSDDGGTTNSSDVAAGTNFTGLLSASGQNEWTVFCNNSFGEGSESISFFVNKTVTTELISPANNTNSSSVNINFVANSTPINTNLTNATLYIWHQNSTLFLTNATSLSGDSEVQSSFNTTMIDGIFLWNVETCGQNVSCGFAANNRTIEIHTTPSTITIHHPNGTINFFKLGENSTLNWTISEPGQNLTEHIINCSYTYNGTLVGLNKSQCIEINQTSFIYVDGVNNLTFSVLEEFGLTTTITTYWNYTVLQINETFRNTTTEGSLEDFISFIKLIPSESISAVALIHNGTTVVGESTTVGDFIEIKKENYIIPGVSADTNVSFYWSILLASGSTINMTTNNQTILNLGLDNCSSYTNRVLNLTMVDEELQTLLSNTTMEAAVTLLTSDRTQIVNNFSGFFENENPLGICLNLNLSNGERYSMDSIIRYEAEGYAIEYYNLVNQTLTNESTTENITLYDLNSSDSTDFQLTFTGSDFLPVENALIFVERQYIAENTFKTVELPKTDANGQTVLHMVRNDVIYNIRVIKNGESLGNFLNIIAFCQDITIGSCTISLNALSNASTIFNYDSGVGILYDSAPTYDNSTNIVSFDFVSSDGTTKVVLLTVERRDIFGNISICNNTVASTSGTVSCNTGSGLTDTNLITVVSINGEEWLSGSVIIDDTGYGNISYVMWFILALSLFLMFSESRNGVMLGMIFSFIGAIAMGWNIGGIIGIGSAGIWVLVMFSVGIWKINKGRTS